MMIDPRWHKAADLLVNRSAKVTKGEKVMIAMHEVHTEPLLLAVIAAVVKAGAYPQVQYLSEKIRHALMKFGDDEQCGRVPDMEQWGMEWADVYIGLRGGFNLMETWDIPHSRRAINQRANGTVSKARWQHTRWCLIRVPSVEMAVEGGMSYEALMDDFFKSCFLDWDAKGRAWQHLKEELEQGTELRITAPDTDLHCSVKGRKWVVFDGELNMPDGEIATAPVTESVHGYIQFQEPAVLGGTLFPNLRLEWQHGKLTDASCSQNQKLLNSILRSDEGAALIGELAFGLNDGLSRFCRDILLDEKIGGTLHIALGRAYPQCGGTNISAIHWDIVLDTRQDSCVYMDGRKIFENGAFLFEGKTQKAQ